MVFSSPLFLLLFLPGVLVSFLIVKSWVHKGLSIYWLVACSALFYAWSSPYHLALLVVLATVNFLLGLYISRANEGDWSRKIVFVLGLVMNVLVLFSFKYWTFFTYLLNPARQGEREDAGAEG